MQYEPMTLKKPADVGPYHFWRRVLIAITAASVFVFGGLAVFSLVGREHWSSLWNMGSHGLIALALVLLVVVQARSVSAIRALVGNDVVRSLAVFVPLVLLAYLVCVGLEVGLGFPREDYMVNLFSGMSLPEQMLCIVMIIVFPPISEELFFRHFLLRVFPLNHRVWKWVAVAVTAGLFMMIHSQYSNWPTLVLMGALGVLFALARIRTGGLAVPILMHSSAAVFGLSLNWIVGQWA
ncbi:CPBP family intramembrane metalloprotease [Pseudomonas sp. P66]|uniref:CPBP family intramembrane metalloprotease n=1 Tax=Pseudomonas arcuscaelestis TaxID=2710591 RepID=A0ABS2BYF4_9PSED|nr:type II CAAX endopeptidase family protein [Pseudomonas arcuscaelestis]MBM5458655.1 CPBP family intramembrane metalloprotease [Pseudomonas arcuscaelestis]